MHVNRTAIHVDRIINIREYSLVESGGAVLDPEWP